MAMTSVQVEKEAIFFSRLRQNREPRDKIGEDRHPEQDVEGLRDLVRWQERSRDDEQHRDNVEPKKRIAEPEPTRRGALVELTQR